MAIKLEGRGNRGGPKRTWRETVEMNVPDADVSEAVAGSRSVRCSLIHNCGEQTNPSLSWKNGL